ncbi:MAG: Beta-hexosaminidase (EC [uncultured Sulfurovum sp.]|uniref:beta-N-acetylhexosaminidase n=1 Tax=uncultured Sulfurovum sp. TaxID=269237 RepID=A0A6S6TB19_9BACT|nr:MAG: Beta-hexosaminidase (EC [uncultured Sulfurovum sp.]
MKHFTLLTLLVLGGCSLNAVDDKKSQDPLILEEQSFNQALEVAPRSLDEKIGSMLMVGFMGTSAPQNSQICQDIAKYNLAGVILFDMNPVNHKQAKNIATKYQLSKLTQELQACSKDGKLLISVDQEGGKVQRLKSKYGFYGKFPKASDVIKLSDTQVKNHYENMGAELASVGINYNLAPDVDLAINKRNHVIYKLGRSFGSDPKQVVKYASIFMDAMHSNGVLTSLKHFPGHGSSLGDTHKGFVDVTNLWQEIELEPYRLLAQTHTIDTVMVAHVFNKRLDSKYPATLSNKIINGKLRGEFGFNGVVITDDLQMGAINKKYGLKNTLKLAINAGNDILLFGNQLSVKSMIKTSSLVNMVKQMIKNGDVSLNDIEASNQRLDNLKAKL